MSICLNLSQSVSNCVKLWQRGKGIPNNSFRKLYGLFGMPCQLQFDERVRPGLQRPACNGYPALSGAGGGLGRVVVWDRLAV